MSFSFHPEARIELLETTQYYEEQVLGLGSNFLDEVEKTLQFIDSFPKLGKPFTRSTRGKLLKRFPYRIIYCIISDHNIEIIAIMHLKRKPDYWRHRL